MIGRTGKLHARVRGKDLYYTIKEVTISNNDGIGFKDKYANEYYFNYSNIIELELD